MLNEKKQDVPQRDNSKNIEIMTRHQVQCFSPGSFLFPDASSLTDHDTQILLPTAEGDIDDSINCIVVYCG